MTGNQWLHFDILTMLIWPFYLLSVALNNELILIQLAVPLCTLENGKLHGSKFCMRIIYTDNYLFVHCIHTSFVVSVVQYCLKNTLLKLLRF